MAETSQGSTGIGANRRISQWDVLPDAIKQRHIDGIIIFSGLAADRPTNSPVVSEILAYWATDTQVLSLWAGAWYSTTLT